MNISIHSISDRLGIDRKSILEWVNNSSALSDIRNNKKGYRLDKTTGIIKNFSDTEGEEIINWLTERRNRNLPISTKSLIGYASSINTNFSNKSISEKIKWAYSFIKRNDFAIRRISHIGQNIPENKNEKIKKFICEIIKKRKELFIEEDEDYCVINMDETDIFLEMSFNTTIYFKGNKHIEIYTNGREHYRLSLMLSAAGDGTKLAPLIILKGEPTKLRNLSYVKIIICIYTVK